MRLPLLLGVLCCAAWSSAGAAEWTEFRGPTAQGHVASKSLPQQWSATEHVAWRQDLPGLGWSSPIVWKNRIYLTTAVALEGRPGNSLRLLCLEGETGKVVWNAEVFQQTDPSTLKIHRKNSHASSSPITEGELLYVHFGNSGTAALDLAGKIKWTNRDQKYRHVHGNGSSPLLVDDLLVVNCDGGDKAYILALDRRTGVERWRQPRPPKTGNTFSFCTPLLIEVEGQRQIISPAAGSVVAYRPADGHPLWQIRHGGYSVVPRPVFGQGLVYVSTGYDVPEILAIRPTGTGDVTDTHIAWRSKTAAPRNASPCLIGNELYTVNDGGIAQCLDARTGSPRGKSRLAGNYSASPVCTSTTIYFLNEEGATTVVKATPDFEKLAVNSLDEASAPHRPAIPANAKSAAVAPPATEPGPAQHRRTLASIAILGDDLLIRTDRSLFCITAR